MRRRKTIVHYYKYGRQGKSNLRSAYFIRRKGKRIMVEDKSGQFWVKKEMVRNMEVKK